MSDDLRAQLSLSLGRNYILDRELEGSGSSRVFIAKDLLTDRDVVVKVLSAVVTDGVSTERFAREVHLAGALQEPHTVPILDTGRTANGVLYYTMPFVGAESLRDRLGDSPIGFDDAVIALRDVARAMAHAHRQGIVHRNIEPGKVFLHRGTAVITDFGISKALEVARTDSGGPRLKLVNTARGAPGYMAPEHATADPTADHRADIYAWGVMAYEVLSDGHPFADITSEEELKAAHVNEPVPVMLHKRYGVPEGLALLVMRCLAKNPAERPASADELLTVLERIPLGSATLALESKNAVRWIGASIALALALFVAGASALWRLQTSDSGEPPLIAVLPFENNGAVSDSLFARGLEIGVRQKLGHLSTLRLIDRPSTRFVSAQSRYAVESGRTLGADYVLATSLRWFHDVDGTALVQVSPSLLHVSDGKVKWTGSPEIASPGDPFAAQAVLATQIAVALGVALSPDDKSALAASGTSDTAAYGAFVRGIIAYQAEASGMSAGVVKALGEFRRALALDPHFADAFAGEAMAMTRMASIERRPDLLDSAMRPARVAIAIQPRQLMALTAASAVAFSHNRPEEAIGRLDGPYVALSSDADALAMHMLLMLHFRDSTAVWRDVERMTAAAPRSVDALLAAASAAQALRRFVDARDLLQRAHALAPNRGDVILRAAALERADGKMARMTQEVRAFLVLQPAMPLEGMSLLRVGDDSMQAAVASARPESFGVHSRSDSIAFYTEKAKLFLARHDTLRANTILDTSITLLRAATNDSQIHEWDKWLAEERLGWSYAARGNFAVALAGIEGVQSTLPVQRWRNGRRAALIACNEAEIFGLAGQFTQVLTQLRRCLTLPGGYSVSMMATEPALARYTSDPRVHALFQELGIEDARIR